MRAAALVNRRPTRLAEHAWSAVPLPPCRARRDSVAIGAIPTLCQPEPAAPATGPGRPPEYCEGRGHNRVSAWLERRRPAAAQAGTTPGLGETDNPVTMAKVTGADADARISATEQERDAAIAQIRADAGERITTA